MTPKSNDTMTKASPNFYLFHNKRERVKGRGGMGGREGRKEVG